MRHKPQTTHRGKPRTRAVASRIDVGVDLHKAAFAHHARRGQVVCMPVYVDGAHALGYDDASHWRIYASFAPQNLAKVEAAIADELQRLNDHGLSDAEVQGAVTHWLERAKQGRSDDKSLAYLLGENLDKDRNFDWQAQQEAQAKRLTTAQVNRAIATYSQPQKWTRVIAGDGVAPN